MKDPSKTNDQLMNELAEMRRQIAELRKSQKRADEARELSHRFLNIVNRRTGATCLLTEIVGEIGKLTGCAAVGIRLLDEEGNIPYEAYTGFSRSFYESESPLSVESDQCMCINVVKGDTDPTLPFFTKGGSFYMNGTTRFLATCPEEEKGERRNKCNQEGYESVALVPIRTRDGISGLIHVADTRENMVPLEMVEVLEIVAQQLATAIERALAEEALRESEERFWAVFEQAADSIVLLDAETGAMMEFNDRAYENLGYTREEFETISLADIEAVESPQEIAKHLEKIREEDGDNFETRHRTKSGELRDVLVKSSVISVRGKKLIASIWHDITEQKQAEEHVRLLFLSHAVEQSSEGLAVSDLEGNLLFLNDAFASMHGYASNEVLGKHLSVFHTQEQMPSVNAINRQMKETGKFIGEIWHVRRDGTTFPTLMHNSLLRDEAGNPIAMIGAAQDITERKQAEEALRERERRFADIAENALEWIWETDADGKYIFASPVVKKLLGYEPEEVLEKHFYDLFHPEDREELRKAAFEVFARREPFREFVNRNTHKSGKVVWLSTSGVPVLDEEGNFMGYRGADTDITDRKRDEDALRSSEEQFSTAFHSGPLLMTMSEIDDGTYIEVNENFTEISGYSRKDSIGTTSVELGLISEKDRNKLKQTLLSKGKVDGMELALHKKSGETFYCLYFGEIIEIAGKQRLLSIAQDITERKQTEDALKEAEERYRAVFEQAADSIMLFDPETGAMLEFNDRACENLGYTREEFETISLADIDVAESPQETAKHIERLVKEGGAAFETRHKTRNGELRDVLVRSKVVSVHGKKFIASIWHDITEQKRAEEELQKHRFHLEDLVTERTAELTRSQQQLRSLAAYIQATREEERTSLAREIHDEFGQMLTSLIMDLSSVEQLISEVDDDDLRHLLLEKVQSMSGLSDETMRTARRISAALRPSVLDHFGVVAAIEWFAQDFQERTGIVCTVTSTEKTLEVGKSISTALFRICQEALTNVARHADATRVAISIKNKDEIHTLTVKDNGRGITETETYNQESFGILGMQERALSIGGDFRISGHPNNGTEVTVRFRAADRKESEEPVRAFESSVTEYVPHAGLEPENDG